MGWLVVGVISIIMAIVSAVASFVSFIIAIVTAIVSAVAAVIGALGAWVAGVVSAVTSAISAAYSAVSFWVSTQLVMISYELGGIYATIAAWGEGAVGAFKGFLNAIYFKELMMIHEIAYIVSADYRKLVEEIYRRISDVSQALGIGAETMNLAFRNARSLVLSASSLMGRSYDIGEITWLRDFSNIMQKIQADAFRYNLRPDLLYLDLDEWVIKSSVNVQAGVMQTVLTTLDSTLKGLKDTVKGIGEVRENLERFVSGLPESIRERVEPMLEPVIKHFDEFVSDIYEPRIKVMDEIVGSLDRRMISTRGEISGIVDRLKRPGDYLTEIDDLPWELRRQQEDKVDDIASRTFQRKAERTGREASREYRGFLRVLEALKKEYPPPPYEIPEAEAPLRPPGVPVKPRDTWFVGEY